MLAASCLFLNSCSMNGSVTLKTGDDSSAKTQIASSDCGKNQTSAPVKGEEIAVMTTNKGVMKIRFFECETPESVKNFKELSKKGFYKNLTFHRIIKNFMNQGGDPLGTGTGGESYKGPNTSINDERNTNLKHLYGAVAMAKSARPNSATSQFYIVNNKNGVSQLDGGYTVFAQVFEGLDTVDSIANVATDTCGPGESRMGCDKPIEPVTIEKVELMPY